MTRAGFGLFGTPGTGRPAAQYIASITSVDVPPHLPSARTGRISAIADWAMKGSAAPIARPTPTPSRASAASWMK